MCVMIADGGLGGGGVEKIVTVGYGGGGGLDAKFGVT